jgi:hypothetical protein
MLCEKKLEIFFIKIKEGNILYKYQDTSEENKK